MDYLAFDCAHIRSLLPTICLHRDGREAVWENALNRDGFYAQYHLAFGSSQTKAWLLFACRTFPQSRHALSTAQCVSKRSPTPRMRVDRQAFPEQEYRQRHPHIFA